MATRNNSGKNLVGFSGGKDEFYVFGWLLECFQQGVECRIRQHVNLVNIVNFEFPLAWSELNVLTDITYVIDGVVRRPVDFDDIKGSALANFYADRVVGIKLSIGATWAIKGLG